MGPSGPGRHKIRIGGSLHASVPPREQGEFPPLLTSWGSASPLQRTSESRERQGRPAPKNASLAGGCPIGATHHGASA